MGPFCEFCPRRGLTCIPDVEWGGSLMHHLRRACKARREVEGIAEAMQQLICPDEVDWSLVGKYATD